MLDVGFYARSPLAAWTRVNRRVFLCLLCERDEDIFPAHLSNNLGGVTPGVCERTRDNMAFLIMCEDAEKGLRHLAR
jgi:hypothetical protein